MKKIIFLLLIAGCTGNTDKVTTVEPTDSTTVIADTSFLGFGAVGDGRTDNYLAFVKAAAYASKTPNVTIRFPKGVYYIAKYRRIKNDPIDHIYWNNCRGLKLIGDSAVISLNGSFFRPYDYSVTSTNGGHKSYTSGLCPFYFIHCDNLEIRNMEITGNVQNTTRAPGIDENNPSVTESNNILLRFTMCNNVTVDNMYLHHAEADGIKISGDRLNGEWINSTNVKVSNVRSYNNGRLGMSVGGLDNGYFTKCDFKNNGFTDGTYGHNDPAGAVDIEPGEFHDNDTIIFDSCLFSNSYGSHFMCTAPNNTKNISLINCSIVTDSITPKTQAITILAKNVLIDKCSFKLANRIMKFTNPLKPGATTRITNTLIEGYSGCINTASKILSDSLYFEGNQFNWTKNTITKNFITLQMSNVQFLNNKVFIPAAALRTRPRGTTVLIQNAIISRGNRFYSEDPNLKPRVSYTGTKIVGDL